ncbi:MAG: ABC transporter ATP-binding protein [Chloroflexi bacterium]|nr:ABC transporter ATP-binding protein [Chloroflexota bacterium]
MGDARAPITAAMLEVRDVSFSYDQGGRASPTLRDLSFSVERGHIASLVGPSGCGKTTLLKVIAGLVAPDSGEVLVGGRASQGVEPEVGYIFQDPRLLPWRTVIQNVMLPLDIQRLSRPQARMTAQRALTVVGLPDVEHAYPAELSGGMKQRVAIARALSYDPAILLMDEPFAALDAISREKLNLEMLGLRQSTGKTMLFVTHSISEAVLMADRVLVMSPRPATVCREISVDLGPDRDLRVQDSVEFTRLTAAVREALEG